MKTIQNIILDTSNIRASGEKRQLSILGDQGAVFSLEIKNEDDSYYNFQTNLFQTTKTGLYRKKLLNSGYKVNVLFPGITDADKYDVYLFSETTSTKHGNYIEVRFPDGSIDINSSIGSNSNLVRKVIYQTLDVTITLQGYSPNATITGTAGTKVITTSREKVVGETDFSFIFTTGTSNALEINTQPTSDHVLAEITATVDATPLTIEGEDIYPAVSDTDVVDGDFSAGTTNHIVMDNNVAGKMVVGDRVTTAVTTDTIDAEAGINLTGASDLVDIIMDNNVATKMAVGDRVTITGGTTAKETVEHFNNNVFVVSALNPNSDNVKEFRLTKESGSSNFGIDGVIPDGTTLTFSSKLNREVITVIGLNPDTDNVKEFSIGTVTSAGTAPANIGIRDNATLSFSNQRNHRWAFDNIHKLSAGMRQKKSTFFTADPSIKEYLVQTTINEGQPGEYKVDNVRVPALDALGILPVTTRNATTNVETTVQTGNVTFSEQALLTFGGGTNATIFSYGTSEINRLTGYDIEFSNLAVVLTEVSTTTTAAVANSTTVNITDRKGITDAVSSVSGIGIDSTVANPTVSSGAGSVTGAGAIVLSTAQTLENGATLTFSGASTIATVTGSIKVNKVGNENVVLRFDLEKFLTMH